MTENPSHEKPQVLMAFACENVKREPGSPVSFENIMDGILAPDFPAPSGRWFAIFSFFSDADRSFANCRVLVEDARGEPIAETVLKDMTFNGESRISRNIIGFQGLTWPYPGQYFIKFIADRDDVLASFPMLVQHQDTGGD